MNAIELKGLEKRFSEFQLGPIDLVIPTGSVVGFIGENGAGKSTTLKLMLDIIKKDAGEIELLQQDAYDLPRQTLEQIGLVLENSEFHPHLNLSAVNQIMRRVYANWDEARFFELKTQFKLPDKTVVKDYSKGMKMKLSLAVALSHSAKLLILDEPTSGLDPVSREEILDIFLEFMQSDEHTILVSSHILSDLEKVCDYIAYIHQGQLVFMESYEELGDNFGIIQVETDRLAEIPKAAIIGIRKHRFGNELLVRRAMVSSEWELSRANIEQIMLFFHRGVNS